MDTTSPIPNRISLVIPLEVMQKIQAAQQTLTAELNPYLVKLTVDERQVLPKIGPRKSDFVARAMSYMRVMPQYLPGFVDIDEFQKDLDALVTLGELQHQIGSTSAMIEDSMMLAGSEALVVALSIYDSLKSAARRGSAQAQEAAADLAERLGTRGPNKSTAKPPVEPTPAPGPTPPAV
jgi:hypothetical protein